MKKMNNEVQFIELSGKAMLTPELEEKIDNYVNQKISDLLLHQFEAYLRDPEKNKDPIDRFIARFFEDESLRTPDVIEVFFKKMLGKLVDLIANGDVNMIMTMAPGINANSPMIQVMLLQGIKQRKLSFVSMAAGHFVDRYNIDIDNLELITTVRDNKVLVQHLMDRFQKEFANQPAGTPPTENENGEPTKSMYYG